MLDTLPSNAVANASAAAAGRSSDAAEHLIEMNAEGASANLIAWEDWWQMKDRTNQELFHAIGQQDEDLIRNLLDENAVNGIQADVNAKDERNQTPLHSCIYVGNLKIAQFLMERFAEVNAQDQEGKTPLHISCTLGNLSLAKLFMSREDCIVSMQDNNGDTPLHIACN